LTKARIAAIGAPVSVCGDGAHTALSRVIYTLPMPC
jgi:hypothetical protein